MKTAKKVIIIGGVAGGASAAARLRRLDENVEITMVERGPYISFANCGLPYHISGTIADREELLLFTAEEFIERFNVKVLALTEATKIHREAKTLELRKVETGEVFTLPYDQLILSPGAEPIRPPLPGVNLPGVYSLRNIPDLDRIMNHLAERPVKRAAVIGAGFIGLETAENLVEKGIEVTLIEKAPQVMPLMDPEMAAFLTEELTKHGMKVLTGVNLKAIAQTGDALSLDVEGAGTVAADLVIMSVGVRPEVKLATEAGLKLGPQGGIFTDSRMRTSDADIFAVGDAVEVTDRVTGAVGRVPLAGPANRQGRLVADVICGREVNYRGTLGTSIVKVFDQTAASVGLTEKGAQRNKIPYEVAWIHGKSHAGYYPGAEMIALKLLFTPKEGKLLGAQAVGLDGVDKRIDVLATALAAGWTVFDLEELDLAYAPPYGSAKDPVNHIGTVAAGMLRGDHPTLRPDAVEAAVAAGALLLDVRSPGEFKRGSLPGALNIPVDDLRKRLAELPKDRQIVVFCAIGVRGYLATRTLMQNGFRAVNLLGAYRLWSAMENARKLQTKPA